MATDISKLGVKTKWQDLTEGMIVAGAGTSKDFHTGEWTSVKPEFIEDKGKPVSYTHLDVYKRQIVDNM